MNLNKIFIISSICLLFCGCATTKIREVEQFNIPVDGNKVSYKIAYQDDRKVNIYISDIYFKEKKVIRPSEEYNWYVYPRWSPDGSKLAFAGITCKSLKKPYSYDLGIFICDENGNNIKKLFSTIDVSNPFYEFFDSHLIWTNDNTKIFFPSPTNSEEYKWVLVSIKDGVILKQGDYDEIKRALYIKKVRLEDGFLPFRWESPDGRWEIYQPRAKTVLLNPRDYFFREDFFGSIEANPTFPYIKSKDATYIKLKKGTGKKIIWPSRSCHTQWTPDSNYIVGYDFLSNKAFIANVEGEVVIFEGENIHIQYKLK